MGVELNQDDDEDAFPFLRLSCLSSLLMQQLMKQG